MKIVYVAGRFRAPNGWLIEQNARRAEEAGLSVAEAGAMPLIPHCNTRHFHGLMDEAFWVEGTIELMRRADAVLLVPGWYSSVGATAERKEALRIGLPVFESVAELRAWLLSVGEPASEPKPPTDAETPPSEKRA